MFIVSTFDGIPLATTVSIALLDVIRDEKLAERYQIHAYHHILAWLLKSFDRKIKEDTIRIWQKFDLTCAKFPHFAIWILKYWQTYIKNASLVILIISIRLLIYFISSIPLWSLGNNAWYRLYNSLLTFFFFCHKANIIRYFRLWSMELLWLEIWLLHYLILNPSKIFPNSRTTESYC